MSGQGTIPWRKLREYLERVSSCQNRDDFLRTASFEVQTLIPFDATANIFDVRDWRHLGGTASADIASSYNGYYLYKMPPFGTWELVSEITNWEGLGHYEFAVDFMWHNGMWKSLLHYPFPGQQIFLSIQRSRLSSNFCESDIDALGIFDQYLNTFYANLTRKKESRAPGLSPEEITERFGSLSKREAEVISLVAARLNTAEIAATLFIGRRTIEKHLEAIFDKLDVHSREQLRWRLGVMPPLGLWRLH